MTRAKTDCFLGIRFIEFLGCGSLVLGVLLIKFHQEKCWRRLSAVYLQAPVSRLQTLAARPFSPVPDLPLFVGL
jgi:hypothetical protein